MISEPISSNAVYVRPPPSHRGERRPPPPIPPPVHHEHPDGERRGLGADCGGHGRGAAGRGLGGRWAQGGGGRGDGAVPGRSGGHGPDHDRGGCGERPGRERG
uniref:Uncharacterized protein n=1 Tax=Amphimedon queenslandica TaxID=400682 RepID=A0A1X7TGP4_AMPQE